MENILSLMKSLLVPGGVFLALILLLIINNRVFKNLKSVRSHGNITKSVISFFLILLGALVFILSLPLEKSTKEQILGFLGIIISAGIALSSTTILGNLIAGLMNNLMDRFKNGDLISLGDLQGRVIEKSAFHTEIQLEDSNFVTVPNLYIATNPVKLTRRTNSVIFTSVSLGYDISRHLIEETLKKAAFATNLKDPYVYIMELGDDAVEYRIHGFLEDSKTYFSTSSQLKARVMDHLHEKGIEIVSPSFRNQRRVDEKEFIPKQHSQKQQETEALVPEELIFNEAIEAQEMEKKKELLDKMDKKRENLRTRLKEAEKTEEEEKLKASINRVEELKLKLEKHLQEITKKEDE